MEYHYLEGELLVHFEQRSSWFALEQKIKINQSS